MGVPYFTTPTFTLSFDEKDLDLTQAQAVFVTFDSGGKVITKSGADLTISEKSVEVSLTQEETASFRSNVVEIQVNWMASGKRIASEVAIYDMAKQLLTKVVT